MAADLTGARWRKSSRSNGNGGACVEVALNLHHVAAIRDSKNPTGPTLVFTPAAYTGFIDTVKACRFDI